MGCSSSDEEGSSFTELESKKTERKEKGMKRNINIILFNIIWLTALIQSCQSKIDSDFASVKSAIDSQNAAYVKAYNNKDAESVAALHTADATVMPPNQKISQGKKEIQNSINAGIQAGGRDLKFQQLELVVSGNIAYEVGRYSVVVEHEDQTAVNDNGKYIVIWERQPNGDWLMSEDIWNSNLPIDCN